MAGEWRCFSFFSCFFSFFFFFFFLPLSLSGAQEAGMRERCKLKRKWLQYERTPLEAPIYWETRAPEPPRSHARQPH